MIKLTGLTSTARQKFILPLETRETVIFKLFYLPSQKSWYFDFNYNNKDYTGIKLSLGENILRAFKYALPFGLKVEAENHIEPFLIDDLESQRVKLYILNKEEVLQVEQEIFGINNEQVE